MLACKKRAAPHSTQGFVELWSFTVRGRDVFYSRFTWYVPAFTADAAPLAPEAVAEGMRKAVFWVCDPDGGAHPCPAPVAPLAAAALKR